MSPAVAQSGYNKISIIAHWLAAVAIVALFFTHEGERGSSTMTFHVGGGAIIGVFLLWRVWHRVHRGFAAAPPQSIMLTILSRFVFGGFLTSIVVVILTGYFLPWSVGQPLDLFAGLSIPSPLTRMPAVHEILELVHDIAGHAFIPLLALHILGVFKHTFTSEVGGIQRMVQAQPDGH
ncbi:MAG: cytochrome b/b6 domain-containing protein [Alphaproteobacteria bacterium]|nr:cytochrome b/b6 domain-containing protein [Alphaproteobacteria bacterium]